MKRIVSIAIIAMLCISSANAQLFKKEINQYGEDKQRTGWWISYWDEEEKVPMSKAKYEAGQEIGTSKEYHQNGNIRLKFRNQKNRMRVKYYTEDRKLKQKGWAVMEYNKADTHYYWHGIWKFYNEKRKLIRTAQYSNGEEVVLNN
jgi:antitoxin component YwqK of YwqJK toxin-antitoxin module